MLRRVPLTLLALAASTAIAPAALGQSAPPPAPVLSPAPVVPPPAAPGAPILPGAAPAPVAPGEPVAPVAPVPPPGPVTPPAVAPPAGETPAAPSVFKRDRAASQPLGLTPDNAAVALIYPDEPVVLRWAAVPGAVSYKVEVASTPAFSAIAWSQVTDQTQVAPELLFPDGDYWWRVVATDAAAVTGVTSPTAQFAKAWPSTVGGLRLTADPTGPPASEVVPYPYLFWSPLPGATEYDVEIAPADQFGSPSFTFIHDHAAFVTPGVAGILADDSYQWRVRGRDPKGNPGPWSAPGSFTKSWIKAEPLAPADDARVASLFLRWKPVFGAEKYEVQVTDLEHNYVGSVLKINATTTNTAFAPTLEEQLAKGLGYGDLWWRVRAVVDGRYGAWSADRHMVYEEPVATAEAPVLAAAVDSSTALTPEVTWSAVQGASLYRVDIATDPAFNNVVDSTITRHHGWAPRLPLIDNQVSTGYYWRVVWGSGVTKDTPLWMVDEDAVPVGQFRKQTRITLGLADGTQVNEPPLLSWTSVDGAHKYELQMSRDSRFIDLDGNENGAVKVTLHGLAMVPGAHGDGAKRLGDGTWFWRVRALDGGGQGQTWSPVGNFTLTSARPGVSEPADGITVVGAPLMRWTAVPQACGYEVQVKDSPAFTDEDKGVSTAQTAFAPTGEMVSHPGSWYWRVRADYCDDIRGQWAPVRSFYSVRPPEFGLNQIPTKIGFAEGLVVTGALTYNGAKVKQPTLVLERRVWPESDYRFFGTVKGDAQGRFAFRIRPRATAAYRLRWAATEQNPEGQVGFAVQVLPRVQIHLDRSKVVRRGVVKVKGSVFPARRVLVQSKSALGWETIRTIRPKKPRFQFGLKATMAPGKHRIRILVPGDRLLATATSKGRGLFVYDKFVIRVRRGR